MLWDWARNRLLGKSRVNQRVHAVDFSWDGTSFVTCGDRHIKWWQVPPPTSPAASQQRVASPGIDSLPPPPPLHGAGVAGVGVSGMPMSPPLPLPPAPADPHAAAVELEGRVVSIVEAQRGATFLDVACAQDAFYAVTDNGNLCCFSIESANIESFVHLEVSFGLLLWFEPSANTNLGKLF